MLTKVLKVGDKIELKEYYQARLTASTSTKSYVSQVLDIINEFSMNIAVPIEGGHLVPLEIGNRYEMSFMTTSGIYMCKCEVKNRLKQNNLYFLAVDIISELKKDQRRQYFRLEKIIPMQFRVISQVEEKLTMFLEKKAYKDDREKRIAIEKLEEFSKEMILGTIVNVSGGGLKFSSDFRTEADRKIFVVFTIEDLTEVEAEARVIGVNSSVNQNNKYEYRVEFTKIKKETREKIVRYVFSEERKQRHKENGM